MHSAMFDRAKRSPANLLLHLCWRTHSEPARWNLNSLRDDASGADHRLRASMGANGRDYIRQNYRWDVIIAKYERMFQNLRKK